MICIRMEIENKSTIFPEKPSKEDEYVSTLSPLQRQAYVIAKEHLKTSFDISRSSGFGEWCKGATGVVPK